MVNKDRILDEVEKTLHTFDHDPTLEPNPFLFTRIQAEKERRVLTRGAGFARRINLKYVVMAVIVLMNLITAAHYLEWNSRYNLHERLVSELKEDFQMAQSQNSF